MTPEETVRRRLNDLTQAVRNLPNQIWVSKNPAFYVPGRQPNAHVDTRMVSNSVEALQRAFHALINQNQENQVKPLQFGQVARSVHEGRPSFQELGEWGVLTKSYRPDGGVTWRVNVDCEINGQWYKAEEEIEWPA